MSGWFRRRRRGGLAIVVAVLVLAAPACGKKAPPPSTIDDAAKLADEIAGALGIARREAEPLADDLVGRFGARADDVFRRYGLDPPPVQGFDLGEMLRSAQLREETEAISAVACNALFNLLEDPTVTPDGMVAAMAEAVTGQVTGQLTETFRGRAYAAAENVVSVIRAVQTGDQAELEISRWLYCDFLPQL